MMKRSERRGMLLWVWKVEGHGWNAKHTTIGYFKTVAQANQKEIDSHIETKSGHILLSRCARMWISEMILNMAKKKEEQ